MTPAEFRRAMGMDMIREQQRHEALHPSHAKSPQIVEPAEQDSSAVQAPELEGGYLIILHNEGWDL